MLRSCDMSQSTSVPCLFLVCPPFSEILAVVMSHSSAEGSRCLYTKEYQGFCSDSVRGIAMSCLCVVVQLLGRCDPEGWELKRAILCGNTISSSTSRLIALPVREAFSKHGLSPERAIYCSSIIDSSTSINWLHRREKPRLNTVTLRNVSSIVVVSSTLARRN